MSEKAKPIGLSQLSKIVAEKSGITQADSSMMVKAVLEAIKEEILKGSKIVFPGFGSFFTTLVGEKSAPNPRTKGERITIPPHFRARWKPSIRLKEELKQQVPTAEELEELNR